MKTLLLLLLLPVLLAGCATSNLARVAAQLKDDDATVIVRVTSIYGTATLVRTNPHTNTPALTATPDGQVTVRGQP